VDLPERDLSLRFHGVVNFDRERNERKAQIALPVGAGALGHDLVLKNKIRLQYVVGGMVVQREQSGIVQSRRAVQPRPALSNYVSSSPFDIGAALRAGLLREGAPSIMGTVNDVHS
jgi:hypothetical protein